jgi:hypothetical protein
VDGGVDIGGAGVDAALQNGHVHKGRAHVDDDMGVDPADQRRHRARVHCIQRMGGEFDLMALVTNARDDLFGFGHGPAGDMQLAEFAGILCQLVRDHLGDATGADDEHVFGQFSLLFRAGGKGRVWLSPEKSQDRLDL